MLEEKASWPQVEKALPSLIFYVVESQAPPRRLKMLNIQEVFV